LLILFLTSLFLSWLVLEKMLHGRRLRRIPLRICVTGTRGKSSVTRMIASVLRESGKKVLAKTTGSQPCLVLPDGTEEEIRRRGAPSIIEQKELVRRASTLNVDCLVAELMSIRPENHFVEGRLLLQPELLVITNIRRDHTEAMGDTDAAAGGVFALAIPPKSTVFLPDSIGALIAGSSHGSAGTAFRAVAANASAPLLASVPELAGREFREDLDLVYELGRHLGLPDAVIAGGVLKAHHDIGRLGLWVVRDEGRICYAASAFAANDPESTRRALARVKESLPATTRIAGFLNLRPDRPDRTQQWIVHLQEDRAPEFDVLFVTGSSARVLRRGVPSVRLLQRSSPELMMRAMMQAAGDDGLIFGFGNMAGDGRRMVEHWRKVGEPRVV
jgi:poly-gamma-glutamate synthase PgsB/CapB